MNWGEGGGKGCLRSEISPSSMGGVVTTAAIGQILIHFLIEPSGITNRPLLAGASVGSRSKIVPQKRTGFRKQPSYIFTVLTPISKCRNAARLPNTPRRGTSHILVQKNGAQTRRRIPMKRVQGLASMSRIKEKKVAL